MFVKNVTHGPTDKGFLGVGLKYFSFRDHESSWSFGDYTYYHWCFWLMVAFLLGLKNVKKYMYHWDILVSFRDNESFWSFVVFTYHHWCFWPWLPRWATSQKCNVEVRALCKKNQKAREKIKEKYCFPVTSSPCKKNTQKAREKREKYCFSVTPSPICIKTLRKWKKN